MEEPSSSPAFLPWRLRIRCPDEEQRRLTVKPTGQLQRTPVDVSLQGVPDVTPAYGAALCVLAGVLAASVAMVTRHCEWSPLKTILDRYNWWEVGLVLDTNTFDKRRLQGDVELLQSLKHSN
ncbi:hypothetical protein EYF80_003084 [Liparis tanakae]|uniref:Uncharacterized protein n=1 Tax=Liparis tanakae TaxID=230148 RepID=A0A4Z2J8S1_9TELE|nr:hypothetical protein EYF80_003084 [Liparis tanakae]